MPCILQQTINVGPSKCQRVSLALRDGKYNKNESSVEPVKKFLLSKTLWVCMSWCFDASRVSSKPWHTMSGFPEMATGKPTACDSVETRLCCRYSETTRETPRRQRGDMFATTWIPYVGWWWLTTIMGTYPGHAVQKAEDDHKTCSHWRTVEQCVKRTWNQKLQSRLAEISSGLAWS